MSETTFPKIVKRENRDHRTLLGFGSREDANAAVELLKAGNFDPCSDRYMTSTAFVDICHSAAGLVWVSTPTVNKNLPKAD